MKLVCFPPYSEKKNINVSADDDIASIHRFQQLVQISSNYIEKINQRRVLFQKIPHLCMRAHQSFRHTSSLTIFYFLCNNLISRFIRVTLNSVSQV